MKSFRCCLRWCPLSLEASQHPRTAMKNLNLTKQTNLKPVYSSWSRFQGVRLCMSFVNSSKSSWLEARGHDSWVIFFFLCLFMERKVVKFNTHEKKEANIKPSWSINNLLNDIRSSIFLQDTPNGQDSSAILPAQVANHRVGFGLSCLLAASNIT